MSYRISGLAPEGFARWFGQPDAVLAAAGVVRVRADAKPGYPCRVTLEDAEPGETLLLFHHVDHDVATPFRNGFAIFVREGAAQAARYEDSLPPVLADRAIALRGYAADGMLRTAVLMEPGKVEEGIRALFAREDVAYIHAHNAAYGCFAARIERA